MYMPLFLPLFISLAIIYLLLGIYASRAVKTTQDYFLAGRSLNVGSLAFTLIATQVGGGLLLGTAQESYLSGFLINNGTLYPLGISIGFVLLGLWFAGKMREFNIATIPELFEVKFNSIILRRIASSISIISLAGITSALIVSSRSLMYALSIQSDLLLISFWLFVIVYTMLGGLKAVILTDLYQVVVIISVFFGVFAYIVCKDSTLVTNIAGIIDVNAMRAGKLNFSRFLLMPMLFSLVEQDLAQRFFAAKNKRIAAFSALWAAIGVFAFTLIPVLFGIKARMMGLTIHDDASPLIVVLSMLTNQWLLAFIICAILAAIISTGDSVLCAMSSLIAQDFGIRFTGRANLIFSQLVTLFAGIASLFVAYFSQNILAIMTQSYELPVSCLFVPVMFCFFSEKYLHKNAAIGAIIGGFIGFVFFRWCNVFLPREIATLLVSFIGYGIGLMIPNCTRLLKSC